LGLSTGAEQQQQHFAQSSPTTHPHGRTDFVDVDAAEAGRSAIGKPT
jgi:hypothetical protein